MSKVEILPQGAQATGEDWRDNWGTPQYILDAVIAVLGGNYFDPCPWNPTWDALAINWPPSSFINPSFSKYKYWAAHGVKQPPQQIWICHTNNSTGWYKQLLSVASGLCLLGQRVHFIDPNTGLESESTAYGKSQSIIYRGDRYEDFKNVFKHLGCVVPIEKDSANA